MYQTSTSILRLPMILSACYRSTNLWFLSQIYTISLEMNHVKWRVRSFIICIPRSCCKVTVDQIFSCTLVGPILENHVVLVTAYLRLKAIFTTTASVKHWPDPSPTIDFHIFRCVCMPTLNSSIFGFIFSNVSKNSSKSYLFPFWKITSKQDNDLSTPYSRLEWNHFFRLLSSL